MQEDEQMDTMENIFRQPVAGPSGTPGHIVPGVGGQQCVRQSKRKGFYNYTDVSLNNWPGIPPWLSSMSTAFSIEHTWPTTIVAV